MSVAGQNHSSLCDACIHKGWRKDEIDSICWDCFVESDDPTQPVHFTHKGVLLVKEERPCRKMRERT